MESEFKFIVRISGKDLNGSLKLVQGISKIRGIGPNLAQYILNSLNIDGNIRIGAINNTQIEQIEKVLESPNSLQLPSFLRNRQKDMDSGKDIHLTGVDLAFSLKNELDRERALQSWRGVRHSLGLKVRGQRTRCTGRGGGAIGVSKAAIKQAAVAAKAKGK